MQLFAVQAVVCNMYIAKVIHFLDIVQPSSAVAERKKLKIPNLFNTDGQTYFSPLVKTSLILLFQINPYWLNQITCTVKRECWKAEHHMKKDKLHVSYSEKLSYTLISFSIINSIHNVSSYLEAGISLFLMDKIT